MGQNKDLCDETKVVRFFPNDQADFEKLNDTRHFYGGVKNVHHQTLLVCKKVLHNILLTKKQKRCKNLMWLKATNDMAYNVPRLVHYFGRKNE